MALGKESLKQLQARSNELSGMVFWMVLARGVFDKFNGIKAINRLLTIEWALRMILLTLVRKSELIKAIWDEVDFENAAWTVSKERM